MSGGCQDDRRITRGGDRASRPHTIRACLTPERQRAFPLHCPGIQRPHVLFSRPIADTVDEVREALRSIFWTGGRQVRPRGRALADRLQAERRRPPSGPRATIRHLAGCLRWTTGRHPSLRQLRMHAPAVEAKARVHLLTMQIQLRLQAPTRVQAECGMARLVTNFEAFTSWPNRLRVHRPRRGKRFDRALGHFRA